MHTHACMCVCVCVCVCERIQKHTHTHIICTQTNIHTYIHTYIHTNKNHLKTPEATPPNAYSSFAYVLGLFCLCTRSLLPMHLKTPEATPPNAYSCRKRWAPRRATTSAPKNLFFFLKPVIFWGGGLHSCPPVLYPADLSFFFSLPSFLQSSHFWNECSDLKLTFTFLKLMFWFEIYVLIWN